RPSLTFQPTAEPIMRILMLLVRDPGGPSSGRKIAIRSAMRSLLDLVNTIHIVAVSDDNADPILPDGVTLERLTPPRTGRVIANVICYATTARLSLNECLFWSPKVAKAVKCIAGDLGADLLVADTLRAFPLAA